VIYNIKGYIMGHMVKKLGLELESVDAVICPVCEQNQLSFDSVNMNAERISINVKCLCCKTNRMLVIKNHKGIIQMFWNSPS